MRTLILLLVLIPFFEIAIFLVFLNFIGFFYSVTEIFITFIVGFYLFSKNKENLLGIDNSKNDLFNLNKFLYKNNKFSFFGLTASILLIVPGYISDVIGMLLLLRPIQVFMIQYVFAAFKISSIKNNFYTSESTETIEGEFYDLHNDKSNISKK